MSQTTLFLVCLTCILAVASLLLYQIKKIWEGMVALEKDKATLYKENADMRKDLITLIEIMKKNLEFSQIDGKSIDELRVRVVRLERDHCEGI